MVAKTKRLDAARQLTLLEAEKRSIKKVHDNKTTSSKKEVVLTERIQIKTPKVLQDLFSWSRVLYNKANNIVHAGFHRFVLWNVPQFQRIGQWIRYHDLDRELKDTPEYRALPSQTSQQILLQVERAWKSYFKALKEWKRDSTKFRRKPNPPAWKESGDLNLSIFTNQQCTIREEPLTGKWYLQFPHKIALGPIYIDLKRLGKLQQVRILPRGYYSIVEIVYKKQLQIPDLSASRKQRIIALDLGVRNLITVVSNCGLRPFVVKGGVVRSINQFYNKTRAHLSQSYSQRGIQGQTRHLERLNRQRNNRMDMVFHKLSQCLISYCDTHDIGTIVIGYNERWKQNARMGKRNNQNFVGIPFYQLIQKIQYKAELQGIEVLLIDESHTSKCSFLDDEQIEHHETYDGTRGVYRSLQQGGTGKVCHGLFKTATGKIINSDVNGAFNILRKAFPEFSKDGIEGLGLVPVAVKFCRETQDFTQLKQLANLHSSLKDSPKAKMADGIEAVGPCQRSPCDCTNAHNLYEKI